MSHCTPPSQISGYSTALIHAVVYYVVRPAEIIVRKEGKKMMRERDLTFKPLRPDR
jgi:hypothetical protein